MDGISWGRERGRHVFVFLVLRKWKVPCLCSCPLKSHFSNWSARPRKSWKWLKSFSLTCWESVASSFLVAISLTSQLLGHVCPTQSKWREGTSWGRDGDIYPHQATLSGPSILGVLGSQSKLAIFSGVLVSVPHMCTCLYPGRCLICGMMVSNLPTAEHAQTQSLSTVVSLFPQATVLSPPTGNILTLSPRIFTWNQWRHWFPSAGEVTCWPYGNLGI